MIDHSLLQPTMTDDDLERGCRLAREYDVASVCIKPLHRPPRRGDGWPGQPWRWVRTIGFPHGGHVTEIKKAESRQATADGAKELDMVVNIGKVLSGDWQYGGDDVRRGCRAGPPGRRDRESDLRELFFERCSKGTVVQDMRRGRRPTS